MIDTFGLELTVLLGLVALVYLLLALAPVLIPAFRAFLRPERLDRPWLFTCTVAALTYGAVYLFVTIVAIPVQAYVVFVAPSLREAGKSHGAWLSSAAEFIATWWWPALPVAVLVTTILLTRKLAIKWAGICAALA